MTDTRTAAERRRDAAAAEYWKQLDELRRVANMVLGLNPPRGRSVATVTKLGEGDYLVEVRGAIAPWTTVVDGKPDSWYFETQDEALLQLIARRHGEGATSGAVFFAGRVLGLSTKD